jgi:hypothetical protein
MIGGSPMEELSCLFWLGSDPDGEESAFLASSFEQESQLPTFSLLDDLLNHAYEGEYLFYIATTDAYAVLEDRGDVFLLTIAKYEQVLLSYVVDAQWAARAKEFRAFIWLFPTGEMTVEQVMEVAKADLVGAYESDQLNVFVVGIGVPDGSSDGNESVFKSRVN